MATWKKIITSGSQAELKTLTLDTALPVGQGGTGATTLTDGGILLGSGTGAITATAVLTDGQMLVGDGTGDPAIESGATLRTSIGVGTGDNVQFTDVNATGNITASNNISASGTLIANDITVAAVTGIDSILATDLVLGEDAQTKIDFETANEIHFYANNAQEMIVQANVVAPGADDGTALGDANQRWSDLFLAEGGVINFDNGDVTITQTGNVLAVAGTTGTSFVGNITASGVVSASGGFVGDGSGLTGLTAAAISTYDNSGDNRIITSVNSSTVNGEANLTFDGSTLSVTGDAVISGDLTINGDLTTIATTNTKVEDQLMFLGTGSAGTNKDVGIVAQSGSTDLQGSAFYNDTDSERWSVAKGVNHNATSITPLQFVSTVKTDTVNPDTTSGSYGAGEMHVNTSTGDIWIRFG
jgi:hypothetical protein